MFYELIYTRCKNGLDILAKKTIKSTGYKVYSCSPEIYQKEGIADLRFLADVASAKQTYKDSYGDDDGSDIFMDDAYLYYSPDFGQNFLVNFHPVHFQRDRRSNYANRAGNFLNHIIAGDFSDFYVWELFADNDIWYAQQKDEIYYYETDPEAMKPREITPSGKYYTYEQIRDFISNGRAELLKKAVSFLISQYKLDPGERKYLLIRDTSSENIELWIAAIECAFSPRMSSGLPFATRMENYKSRNIYTVINGIYQTTRNFQNSNHKRRFRAMIIGLNTKDTSTNNNVRPLPTDEFVLLDAETGETSFETEHDLSGGYFSLVTSFSSDHRKFCTEFLQSFSIKSPVYDLPELYKVYKQLQDTERLSDYYLGVISKYGIVNTETASKIYYMAKEELPAIFESNFASALCIAKWLKDASEILGDKEIRGFLSENICGFVKSALLNIGGNTSRVKDMCLQVLSGNFKEDIAQMLVNPETVSQFSSEDIMPEDCLCFLELYFKSAALINSNVSAKCVKKITSRCIELCAELEDKEDMTKLFLSFAGTDRTNFESAVKTFLASAEENGQFVVNFLLEEIPNILSGFESVSSFCKMLNASGLKNEVPYFIGKYLSECRSKSSLFEFPKFISECEFIDSENKKRLFLALDNRIKSVDDNNDFELSARIQKYCPIDYDFPNSANIAALHTLKIEGRAVPLRKALEKYRQQGFPNMIEGNYPEKFAETIVCLSDRFAHDDLRFVFGIIIDIMTPPKFLLCFVQELMNNIETCHRTWTEFLFFSVIHEDKDIRERALNAIFTELCKMSNERKVLRDIKDIEIQAKKDMEKKKSPGFLGRLLRFGKFYDSDSKNSEN